MYIEGIALEHFSSLPKADSNTTTPQRQHHALVHSFYLMTANRMLLIILHTASV